MQFSAVEFATYLFFGQQKIGSDQLRVRVGVALIGLGLEGKGWFMFVSQTVSCVCLPFCRISGEQRLLVRDSSLTRDLHTHLSPQELYPHKKMKVQIETAKKVKKSVEFEQTGMRTFSWQPTNGKRKGATATEQGNSNIINIFGRLSLDRPDGSFSENSSFVAVRYLFSNLPVCSGNIERWKNDRIIPVCENSTLLTVYGIRT